MDSNQPIGYLVFAEFPTKCLMKMVLDHFKSIKYHIALSPQQEFERSFPGQTLTHIGHRRYQKYAESNGDYFYVTTFGCWQSDSFVTGELVDDYPNLVSFGMMHSDRDSSQMICKMIPHSTHRTLRYLTISTGAAVTDVAIAKRVCELVLQFPKASTNWWSSCYGIKSER
ncbi:hypothetical protein KGF57_003344 [Candida theae]|uniref:Uncharacterized protein n=1 Tax=Candida theae TaxID=1198502 RepID=A0AAD5BEG6_9ASCO|nr:uncharacterized protein KGF57_003344 [Candida theae]KAI5957650.1 hypothetical protein KGF57_003344 [Candida theae]